MKIEIVVTPDFDKNYKSLKKKYPSIKEDVEALMESLKTEPVQGDALGKDCYKIRLNIKSKNRGKSGGGRVITCVKILAETVYLLTIYDKSDTESITTNGLIELLNQISSK